MKCIGVIFLVVFTLCQGVVLPGCRGNKESAPAAQPEVPHSKQVTCPVCGLKFSPKDAASSASYQGTTYYFYLEDHRKAFLSEPEAYLSTPSTPNTPPAAPVSKAASKKDSENENQ